MRGVVQVFRKDPESALDFQITFAIGAGATLKSAGPAPTVVVKDICGNPLTGDDIPTISDVTIVDGENSEAGSADAISFRIAGGKKGMEYLLTAKATASDTQVFAKTVWLVTDAPLGEAEDTAVIRMGAPSGISAEQLRAGLQGEARARAEAIATVRTIVDANTAKRVRSFDITGRNIVLGVGPDTGSLSVELPNSVVSITKNSDGNLVATHIDGATNILTIEAGGGGGGQTAQQVQQAIDAAIDTLRDSIPAPASRTLLMWGLEADGTTPPAPVIPDNKLKTAGQGFTDGDVIVGIWRRARPATTPAGQTLWLSIGILYDDNSRIVTDAIPFNELSEADQTAIDNIPDVSAWALRSAPAATTVPDIRIPKSITRDEEAEDAFNGVSVNVQDKTLTFTRLNLRREQGQTVPDLVLDLTALLATVGGGDGGSGAADSLVGITARGAGKDAAIVTETRAGNTNAVGYPSVPIPESADQVMTSMANGEYGWANIQIPAEVLAPYATIAELNTALKQRDGLINLLSEAINANVVPEVLKALAPDVRVTPHPAGVWEQTDDSTVKMNIGGAFLFENSQTGRLTIPQEIAAVSGYSAADLTGANFVREHADPNEDSNPWRGVTPYCVGPLPITTPANLRRKVLTFYFGQMSAERSASNNLTAETEFLRFGTAGLLRFNRGGLWARIGTTAPANQTITHFLRVGRQNLSSLGDGNQYVLAPLNSSFTGASRKLKLTAELYDADEGVARSSTSVEVTAVAGSTGFTIPVPGRTPLTGNVTYNGATRVITINITGGSKEPDSHIVLNVGAEETTTYTRPGGVEYTGLLAADSLTPGNAEVFTQNHLNQAVFAFEQVYDEPPGPDNLMKLVWRINDLHHTTFLHQTRAQLQLDSTDVRVGTTLTYISHLQISSSGEELGEGDLDALQVGVKGWGQLVRNHRDDNVDILAQLAAHGIYEIDENGNRTKIIRADDWAQVGNPNKIPADKIPVGVTAPSGIILPRVITVPHFTAQTADVDLGFRLDGSDGVRGQYWALVVPVEYKVGRDQAEINQARHRFSRKMVIVPLDALPRDTALEATGTRHDRYFDIDFYPDTLQRIALHVWQENTTVAPQPGQIQPPRVSNVHFSLVYWNNSDGRNYQAPLPAQVTHFSGLSVATFHDANARQVYLMPRSAKGEPGDTGPKGDTGEKGEDGSQGPAGPAGAPGADGADGAAGPKGDTGDTGPAGPAGADGQDGAPGAGVPAGGTQDQVLTKRSNADRDTYWTTPSNNTGGGGGTTTPVDPDDHYLELGQRFIDNQVPASSGVANGVINLGALAANAQDNRRLQFSSDTTAFPATNIPRASSASPNRGAVSAQGDIILPQGTWTVSVSANLRTSGVGGSTRTFSSLQIQHRQLVGGSPIYEPVASSTLYMRNRDSGNIAGLQSTLQGNVSVSATIVSDGVQPIAVGLRSKNEAGGAGTLTVLAAHITAAQEFVGGVNSGDSGGGGGVGPAGPQGPKGDTGDTGPAGAQGPKGDTGDRGATGPAGIQGAPGPTGPQGDQGIQGPAGPAGAQGDAGPAGAAGEQGARGPAGQDGADGATGPAGPAGADGAQGQTGPAGPAGADGQDGAPGAQGPAGQDGAQGPAGADGADGARGEQGPPGADGATGPAGPKGDKGDQGETGATGPQGPPGTGGGGSNTQAEQIVLAPTSPNVAAVTLPENYNTFKSVEVVVLDNNGQITTRDIVVDWLAATASHTRIRVSGAGFISWLRSARTLTLTTGDVFQAVLLSGAALVGGQGPAGPAGPAGADGAQGPAGADGADGARGEQGPPGAAGADGATGPAGPKGDKGDQGETGATGPAGPQGPPGTGGGGTPGTTVSGTSGWGANLLASELTIGGATGTINLSGDVDSILVVAAAYTAGRIHHKGSVEVIAPLSPAESHQLILERTAGGTGFLFNFIEFSFPTTTGANAQIRLDAGQDGSRIIAVYKKTRISGSAVGPAGPEGPAGAAGAQGQQGARGPAGQDGAQGQTGPAGAQGPRGDTGPAGPKGDKGDQGNAGPAGAQGQPGAQGATGPAGPAPTNAQLTAVVKPFARAASSAKIADGDIGDRAITGAKIARGTIDGNNLSATIGLSTQQRADVNQLIASHESDQSHPDDGLNQGQVRSEIDSRVHAAALTANPTVQFPASKVSGVATTSALNQVAADVANNNRKVGLPVVGEGQVAVFKNGAWTGEALPDTQAVSPDGSIEPDQFRARILEQVLQHGSKADNFSVYTFANSADNFTYKGVTGRIDRARLELQNSVLELRWTGFTARTQLAGLMVRITSGGVSQEFAADSGTDFSLGESSYLSVNTAGLGSRPLAIDVYIAEHDDAPAVGDVYRVNDSDSGEWVSGESLVAGSEAIAAAKRETATVALSTASAQSRADDAFAAAGVADDAAAAAQRAADSKRTEAQVNQQIAAGVKSFARPGGGQVSSEDIRDGAVTAGKIGNSAVTNAKIGNNAVTTDKIQNGAVTAGKIGRSAVGENELADLQVTSGKLRGGAVTAGKIGNNAVATANIQDGAVTAAKIAGGGFLTASQVDTRANNRIVAMVREFARAASRLIRGSDIENRTITADKIANGVIPADQSSAVAEARRVADAAAARNTEQDTLIAAQAAKPSLPSGGTAAQVAARDANGNVVWEFVRDLRPTASPGDRKDTFDFNTLASAGNSNCTGIWSDGETMYVVDGTDDKIYAYDLTTKARIPAKDFNTLVAAGNRSPAGLWSDGVTMYVGDSSADKIFAYNLTTKARISSRDFNTLAAAGNGQPSGLWSDGVVMYVGDGLDNRIYRYNLATKAVIGISSSYIRTSSCCGLWGEGDTLYVLLGLSISAFNRRTGARDTSKQVFNLPIHTTRGIWSDGVTMYVGSYRNAFASQLSVAKIFAFHLVPESVIFAPGSIDVNLLAQEIVARLLPPGGTTNQVAVRTASGGVRWVTLPGVTIPPE